jgi:serine protease AprX
MRSTRRRTIRVLAGIVVAAAATTTFAVSASASTVAGTVADVPAVSTVDATAEATVDATAEAAPDASAETVAGYEPTADPHSLLRTTEVVGARSAWATSAGAGVDVAVIDTGIAPVRGLADTGRIAPGVDLSIDQAGDRASTDRFGHGTHMAGIIAGRDAGPDPAADAGSSSRFLGVAPSARVVPVKVGDRNGNTDVSQVIAGLNWVVENARTDGRNIRVVNLSFGTDSLQDYQVDPLAYAAERAWHAGIVVVVSAGNRGASRLSDPAYDPYLLAVGAAESSGTTSTADDSVLDFSNRGDGVRGPDLVAPGRSQQSLRVPGSRIDVSYGSTGRIGERFFRGTGTSQAAAVVAGAAAVVLADRPTLSPDQVKRLLVGTAHALPGQSRDAQGAGMVDVAAAVAAPTPDAAEATQRWTRSVGSGTVQRTRGTAGTLLNRVRGSIGDHGVESFAQTNDPVSVGAATAAAARTLTSQATVRSWDGMPWDGNAWDGNAWDGNAWDGNAWDGNAWDGNAWDGNAWDGHGWG